MSQQPEIPTCVDELTVTWLNQAVCGQFPGSVTGVAVTRIGEGIGFIGELYRCVLTWDESDISESTDLRQNRPASVIVKIPSSTNRDVGEVLKAFEREIFAYRDLGSTMGLPMPAFMYAAMDPDPVAALERPLVFLMERLPLRAVNRLIVALMKFSGKSTRRYVLVMEDIVDAAPPSQVAGGSIDDALQALELLAMFHATHWQSSLPEERAEEADLAGLVWPLSRTTKVWQASYLRNRDEFVSRFGDRVGASNVAKLDKVQEDLVPLFQEMTASPWTLLHGDYRLDNILFRANGEIVIVDYQMLAKGSPAWDVSYFITTALTAENKPEQDRMLRHYHDRLLSSGRTDYPFEALVTDVETAKLLMAHRCVCGLDSLQADIADDGGSLVDLMVTRIMDWID